MKKVFFTACDTQGYVPDKKTMKSRLLGAVSSRWSVVFFVPFLFLFFVPVVIIYLTNLSIFYLFLSLFLLYMLGLQIRMELTESVTLKKIIADLTDKAWIRIRPSINNPDPESTLTHLILLWSIYIIVILVRYYNSGQ